jgi:hypothetical protein
MGWRRAELAAIRSLGQCDFERSLPSTRKAEVPDGLKGMGKVVTDTKITRK